MKHPRIRYSKLEDMTDMARGINIYTKIGYVMIPESQEEMFLDRRVFKENINGIIKDISNSI
jgi:hypothetical protein